MSFFTKSTYKEVSLPFIHDCYGEEYEENKKAGLLDIEVYDMQKYFYASFVLKKCDMYSNGDYDLLYSNAQWCNRYGVNQYGYFFFDDEQFNSLISNYKEKFSLKNTQKSTSK